MSEPFRRTRKDYAALVAADADADTAAADEWLQRRPAAAATTSSRSFERAELSTRAALVVLGALALALHAGLTLAGVLMLALPTALDTSMLVLLSVPVVLLVPLGLVASLGTLGGGLLWESRWALLYSSTLSCLSLDTFLCVVGAIVAGLYMIYAFSLTTSGVPWARFVAANAAPHVEQTARRAFTFQVSAFVLIGCACAFLLLDLVMAYRVAEARYLVDRDEADTAAAAATTTRAQINGAGVVNNGGWSAGGGGGVGSGCGGGGGGGT